MRVEVYGFKNDKMSETLTKWRVNGRDELKGSLNYRADEFQNINKNVSC